MDGYPDDPYNDFEYNISPSAVAAGAITAYRAGATGKGVTIAVVDSGINPEAGFEGRIHPASQDLVGERGIADTGGHGTAVSSVAATGRDNRAHLGVAFDATVLSLNASQVGCGPESCSFDTLAIARAIDIARENGARVINLSLGADAAPTVILEAIQRAAAAGVVVVVSAGNGGAANPNGFARDIAAAGAGLTVIAGAHTGLGEIASWSNRAGSTTAFLLALGENVAVLDHGNSPQSWEGTSLSAPAITGAVALLAQAFPNLTGAQIVEILFRTALDFGAPGPDSIYGNGVLSISRAFQPIGATRVAGSGLPVSLSENGHASEAMGDAGGTSAGAIILDGYSRAYVLDLARTLRRAGQQRPLSQALRADLASGEVIAGVTSLSITVQRRLYGRGQVDVAQPSITNEDRHTARAIAGHALAELTPRMAVALGFSESGRRLQERLTKAEGAAFVAARDPMARIGFFAEASESFGVRHDLGLVALTITGERGRVERQALREQLTESGYTLSSATADRRIGRAKVMLGASHLKEENTVLGGRFEFAPLGSQSYFLDATAAFDFGDGWRVGARYRRGWTSMPGGNGLVEGGEMSSNAWAFDASRRSAFVPGDQLAIRVMQPLRISSGGYLMNVPVSYDYTDLSVGYDLQTFSLAPSGREIDIEAAYVVGLPGRAGHLGANAFLRRQPGNISSTQTDVGAAVRFTLAW